ncbi:DNA-binding protein, partial [Vibrio sp. 10N.261.49.A5]
MKEWFQSSDLMDLPGMPSTRAGVSSRARREDWKSRKARGMSRGLEYHISSFNEEDLAELREKFGSEVIPDNVT